MKKISPARSFDPEQSCGLSNIGIDGIAPGKIAEHLWETKRIIVVGIGHRDATGIRVTPNVYTTLNEIDTFIESFEEIRQHGIPT